MSELISPSRPVHVKATILPSGEKVGDLSTPGREVRGVITGLETSRPIPLMVSDNPTTASRARATLNHSQWRATPRATGGLGPGSIAAMNRYPFRGIV